MVPARILGGAAAVVMAAGVGLLASTPVSVASATASFASQPQAISFTTRPPVGANWMDGATFFGIGYQVGASASSGLPVVFSVAPESAGVCRTFSPFSDQGPPPGQAYIGFTGPGTCTIYADQPGDSSYLPAPRASQSFQIDKVATSLSKPRARKGLPGLTPTTFSATLDRPEQIDSHSIAMLAFPQQVVSFAVGGQTVCSGITDASGVATCTAMIRAGQWLPGLRWTATYAGNALYKSSSTTGWLIG
jgi:hypothetical protein